MVQGLKKRFCHEDHFHQEYARYMNKLSSKGYEELGVLARFRQEPLASMGNIRAQFLQVKVPDFRWRYHKGS